ncbi:MAG: SCO family protein [Bacteroidota bacterium]
MSTIRLCCFFLALALAGCASQPDHLAPEDDLSDESWTLVDRDSAAVAFPDDLLGQPVLLSAIYTHCPDVCLMTMANMVNVRRELGADTAGVTFATVSFDPARDTPAVLRRYAETWRSGPDWRLLTGDSTEVAGLMERIGVRYEVSRRDTLASGEATYSVSHTDKALLLDAEGRIVETYGGSAGIPEMIADDIRALR